MPSSSPEQLPSFWLDNPVYVRLDVLNGRDDPSSYQLSPLLNGQPTDEVSFQSSDPAVASVDGSGLVTALSAGSAVVTATYGPDPSLVDTIKVEVKESATAIAAPEEIYLAMGDSFDLAPELIPSTSTDGREYGYYSSEEDVATVSPDGTITAVGYGDANVVVYCLSNGLSTNVEVNVDARLDSLDFVQVSTDPDGRHEFEVVSYHGQLEDGGCEIPAYYRDGVVASIGEGAFEGLRWLWSVRCRSPFLREIKARAFADCHPSLYFYYSVDSTTPLRIGEEAFAGAGRPFYDGDMKVSYIPSNVVEIASGAFDGISEDTFLDVDGSCRIAEEAIVPVAPINVFARPSSRPEEWASDFVVGGSSIIYGVESLHRGTVGNFDYYLSGGSSPHAVICDSFFVDTVKIVELPSTIDGYPVEGVTLNVFYDDFDVYLPSSIKEIIKVPVLENREINEIYVEEESPLAENTPPFIDLEYLHFGCLDYLEDDERNAYVERRDEGGESYLTIVGQNYWDIGSLAIRDSYESIPVKAVGRRAFERESSLDDLVIPDGVIRIEERAFESTNINALDLGTTVERIEDMAFYQALRCRSLFLPDSLAYVGASAFYSTSDTSYFLAGDNLPETGDEFAFYAPWATSNFVFDCAGVSYDDAGRLYAVKEGNGGLYATLYSLSPGIGVERLASTVRFGNQDVPVTKAGPGVFDNFLAAYNQEEWYFVVLPETMVDFDGDQEVGAITAVDDYGEWKKARFFYDGPAIEKFEATFTFGIASFGGEVVLHEGAYYASVAGASGKYATFLGLESEGGDNVLPASIPFASGELPLLEAAPGSGSAVSASSITFPSSLRYVASKAFFDARCGRVVFNSSVEIGDYAFDSAYFSELSFSAFPFVSAPHSFSKLVLKNPFLVPKGSRVSEGFSISACLSYASSVPLLAFEDGSRELYDQAYSWPVVVGYRGEVFFEGGYGYALAGEGTDLYLLAFAEPNRVYSEIRLPSQVTTASGTFPVRGIAHEGFPDLFGVDVFLPSSIVLDELSNPFPELSFSVIYITEDYSDGDQGIDEYTPDGHNALVYGYGGGDIFTTGDGVTYAVTNEGLYLVSASDAYDSTSIDIPSSIVCPDGQSRSVYGVADEAFSILRNLEEVRLPSTVRMLGRNLFFGSPNVRRFYVPFGLAHAFEGEAEGINVILEGGIYGSLPDWVDGSYQGCEAIAGFTGTEFESGGIVYGLFQSHSAVYAVAIRPADPIDGLSIPSSIEYGGVLYKVDAIALSFVRAYEGMGSITIHLEGSGIDDIPVGEGNVSFVLD